MLDSFPVLETVITLERRQIVPARGLHHVAGLFLLRKKWQQGLPRRLVLGERPQAIEEGELADETPGGATRHVMGPALLRHLWVVALGNRPGARRGHDARPPSRDSATICAGILPGRDLPRTE